MITEIFYRTYTGAYQNSLGLQGGLRRCMEAYLQRWKWI